VLVEGQDEGEPEFAQLGDAGSQHHHQDEHGRKVEALACGYKINQQLRPVLAHNALLPN
jgi:hypothetical protein